MPASEASSMKGCAWSITINNPTDADLELWKSIRQIHWVKDAQGQLECGENGTPHIQGLLKTQSVRFAQVKKLLPRAHIEKAKNLFALTQYVAKEETRLAPIANDMVASPRVVQERLTSIVMEKLYDKGNPIRWRQEYIQNKFVWKPAFADESDTLRHLYNNKEYIQAHSDEFLDKAVAQLIENGYYGIEFAVANNQVRNGYKKYMSSIIIRHYASQVHLEEEDQASVEAQAPLEEIDE